MVEGALRLVDRCATPRARNRRKAEFVMEHSCCVAGSLDCSEGAICDGVLTRAGFVPAYSAVQGIKLALHCGSLSFEDRNVSILCTNRSAWRGFGEQPVAAYRECLAGLWWPARHVSKNGT